MKPTKDQITLLTALQDIRVETDSFAVIAAIQRRTGKQWSLGKVYDVYDTSESEGFVNGRHVPGGPERGGKDRYLVSLTDAGRAALASSLKSERSSEPADQKPEPEYQTQKET